MTRQEIADALDRDNWDYNRKPDHASAVNVLADLPVEELNEICGGGALRVVFERPLTQGECWRFIQGMRVEVVSGGDVTDDQTEFALWWD